MSERLLREGSKLAIVDDLNDFYSPSVNRANLEEVRRARRMTFYQADIRDEEKVFAIGREQRYDAIIHVAARAGVWPSAEAGKQQ